MFTRFKSRLSGVHAPLFVPILETQEVEENGCVTKQQVSKMVNICDPDYCRSNLPSVEEYSYENLLSSGVSLREVNSVLLTSRERLALEASYLAPDALDKISDVLEQARATKDIDSQKPTETDSQEN